MLNLRALSLAALILPLIHCGGNSPGSSSSAQSSESSLSVSSSSSSVPSAQPRCSDEESAATKQAVTEALTMLFLEKNPSAIDQYWADPYLQHNPIANSGVATFKGFMGSFVTQSSFSYELLRVYAECDLAIVQGRYSLTGLIFDMFRVENGKLIEHWDSDSNQSSNANGPTEVIDQALTHENRETINSFYEDVLVPNNTNAMQDYFRDDAPIHRNNQFGASGFNQHLQQSNIRYQTVHHVIADGNFVFVMAEATLNGGAYALYDLYRLDEGEIAEHWDSRRVVPNSTASGLGIF